MRFKVLLGLWGVAIGVFGDEAPHKRWVAFGDVLYWRISESNCDWASKRNPIGMGMMTDVANQTINFGWDWGFRGGIGLDTNYDKWDSVLYYTGFNTSSSNSMHVKDREVSRSTHGINAAEFSSGKNEMKVHFSMFDWEVGRMYSLGDKMMLRPHAGIKGGWIRQSVDQQFVYLTSNRTSKVNQKNDFWGIGVSVGADSTWTLYECINNRFSAVADLGAGLMYGHFDNSLSYRENQNHTFVFGYSYKGLDQNLATSMLQAMLGFMWDCGIRNDRLHFFVKMGYEWQCWFGQNQMLNVSTVPQGYSRLLGDLALQGLTVEFRLKF